MPVLEKPDTGLRNKSFILLAAAVLLVSVLPIILNLVFDIDFGSHTTQLSQGAAAAIPPGEWSDAIYRHVSGSMIHTILEWSAFCTAIFTAILALVVFRIKHDMTVPIIAIALLWAGCMDAFHALAADRLINATADNTNLIPFTWAICRAFNALIVLVGVSVLLLRKNKRAKCRGGFWFIATISIAFAVLAYAVIHYCAVSLNLPQTMFPDAIMTRPWDGVALIIFVINAVLLWRLHRHIGSAFTAALLLASLPNVATQLHMTFGSAVLFDNHSNIAHFLKIITYLVPFVGLVMDYITTYRREQVVVEQLQIEAIERSRAENLVAKANVHLRAQMRALDEFAIVSETDMKGTITFFNDLFCKISGYSREELIGQNYRIINSGHHPKRFFSNMWNTIAAGEVWRGEVKNRCKDGSYYWVDTSIAPTINTRGEIEKYLAIQRVITDQKAAEEALCQVNEELGKTNQELEQFVYTASHDLKSPIVTIQGFLGHLRRDAGEGRTDRLVGFVDRIDGAAGKMRDNIDDLLELSRIGRVTNNPGTINVTELVQSLVADQQDPIKDKAVTVHVQEDMPSLWADRSQIIQIFDNLITNALKYGCDADQPAIHIGAEQNNGETRFFVKDNGQGIDPEYHDKVFGLFQRLKTDADGTGIGLALVKRVLELHHGRAWVVSQVGEGATFWLSFPQESVQKVEV